MTMQNVYPWRLWSILSLVLVLILAACSGQPAAEPEADATVAEEPAAEEPATDEVAEEEPASEEATTEEDAAEEEPASEEAAEEPATDEAAEEAAEDTAADDASAEEAATEEEAAASAPVGDPVVNVYSARHYGAVEEVMERFTAETGIEVLISQGSTQSLVERIIAEGEQTPADAVITIDGGSIELLANEGVLAPIESDSVMEVIPENLRDPEGQWIGLSQRVRTLMYNPANVSEEEAPATYADLADPQWSERLCLRPASHIYTIALVASIIANEGEEEATRIVNGWVANSPTYIDSDTRILETMEAGGCDAGITNHYYLGRILDENAEFPVQLVWANQETTGVHRNVVAMGVLESARNKENAFTLMEWLATEGQGAGSDTISGGNHEFPASPDAEVHPVIAEFGEWEVDPLPLGEYGTNQAAALQLLEAAGYGFDESIASN